MSGAVRVNTPNYDYYYMCPELRHKRMVPTITRVLAHSIEEFGELIRHPGEEYIYVLKGPIEIHTEFYEPILLDTGESIYIDSTMGHAYVAPKGNDDAMVLGICTSPAEDLMERLMTRKADRKPADKLPAQPPKKIAAKR